METPETALRRFSGQTSRFDLGNDEHTYESWTRTVNLVCPFGARANSQRGQVISLGGNNVVKS